MAKIDLESGMPKFYELKTELTRSMENLEELKGQYAVLNEIVENSGRKEELPENFVESLETYKTNIDKQLSTISDRLSYIQVIIDKYEKQDNHAKLTDKIVTLALSALGIINAPQVEEEQKEEAE